MVWKRAIDIDKNNYLIWKNKPSCRSCFKQTNYFSVSSNCQSYNSELITYFLIKQTCNHIKQGLNMKSNTAPQLHKTLITWKVKIRQWIMTDSINSKRSEITKKHTKWEKVFEQCAHANASAALHARGVTCQSSAKCTGAVAVVVEISDVLSQNRAEGFLSQSNGQFHSRFAEK